MLRTWNLLHSAALANAYDPVATKPYESHPLSDLWPSERPTYYGHERGHDLRDAR